MTGAVGILLPPGYEVSSDVGNGILCMHRPYLAIGAGLIRLILLVCASCCELFQLHYIGLSPTIQVLNYILHYLTDIPEADQLPLYEVCPNPNGTSNRKNTQSH